MEPRLLTKDEIQSVLDNALCAPGKAMRAGQAAPVRALLPEVGQAVYDTTLERLRYGLAQVKITPQAIPELQEAIARAYDRARVVPGTAVGVRCSEALGGPVTQMALNSFHQSGAGKDIGSGIDELRSLLTMSDTKYPSCTIHFKRKTYTEREVLELRKDLVALTLQDITKDYDIGRDPEPDDAWWLAAAAEAEPEHTAGVSRWFLRVVLDVPMMIEYGIGMDTIRSGIERSNDMARIVCGPLRLGVFYMYINPEFITKDVERYGGGDNAVPLYIETTVLARFPEITFRGLRGLKRVFPVVKKTIEIVATEQPAYSKAYIDAQTDRALQDVLRRSWQVMLNQGAVRSSGVTPDYLAAFFDEAGIEVVDVSPMEIRVVVPQAARGASPTKWASERLTEEKKETQARRVRALQENKAAEVEAGPLERLGSYTYAETTGTALSSLLTHPLVDPYYTYSNEINRNTPNMQSVYELFGIEAARNLWILQFKATMDRAGEYADPRHIMLIADNLFNQGRPNSVTFRGINRQRSSVLSRMTIEKAMEVVSHAAFVGTTDDVASASAAIMIGRPVELGAGYIDPLAEPAKEKAALDELKAQQRAVPVDALVEELTALGLEERVADVTEDDMFAAPMEAAAAEPVPEAPRAARGAVEEAPDPVPEHLVFPPQVLPEALLGASQDLAMTPVLPQGVDTLVFMKEGAGRGGKKRVRAFRPPALALVVPDDSGTTSYAMALD